MTMTSSSIPRLRLLGLASVLLLAGLALYTPSAQAIGGCIGQGVTTYYNDAAHSTVVGQCATGCCTGCPGDYCGCRCTGVTSPYYTHQTTYCPDVICNPST